MYRKLLTDNEKAIIRELFNPRGTHKQNGHINYQEEIEERLLLLAQKLKEKKSFIPDNSDFIRERLNIKKWHTLYSRLIDELTTQTNDINFDEELLKDRIINICKHVFNLLCRKNQFAIADSLRFFDENSNSAVAVIKHARENQFRFKRTLHEYLIDQQKENIDCFINLCLVGEVLDKAWLDRVNFSGTDFSHSDMDQVSFDDTNLDDCRFYGTQYIDPIRLSRAKYTELHGDRANKIVFRTANQFKEQKRTTSYNERKTEESRTQEKHYQPRHKLPELS